MKTTFPDWFNQAWPDTRLDAMRNAGDPLADDTIAAIFKAGDRNLVNALLPLLQRPDQWPANTPSELRDYLARSQRLPTWADPAIMARAWEFMSKRAVAYNLVLLFLSLPILSAWQTGGAQTLALTGQLTNHFVRRLSETLRFVLAVIADKGLDGQGSGIRTTKKVRLMHAAIRHFASTSKCPDGKPYWNPQWGRTINQEALTATMLAFSTVAVAGLKKLEVAVTREEEDAVLHLWKVIGHILGIDDRNMPASCDEARLLWHKCVERNFGRTKAGVALTEAHIAFVRDLAKDDPVLADFLGEADEAMMRFLMGRDIAERMLGLPRTGLFARITGWILRVLFGEAEETIAHNRIVQKLVREYDFEIVRRLQAYLDDVDVSRPFAVPSEEVARAGLQKACAMNEGDSPRPAA